MRGAPEAAENEADLGDSSSESGDDDPDERDSWEIRFERQHSEKFWFAFSGYYSDLKADLIEPTFSVKQDDTSFGVGGGVGVQHRIPQSVGFFAEVLYVAAFTSDETTYYVSARGGLNLYFRFRQ